MSAKAKAALDAAHSDPELLKAILNIVSTDESDEAHRDNVAKVFANHGFQVDPDDLFETAMSDPRFNHKLAGGELANMTGEEVNSMSSEELEKIAGGEWAIQIAIIGSNLGPAAMIAPRQRRARGW